MSQKKPYSLKEDIKQLLKKYIYIKNMLQVISHIRYFFLCKIVDDAKFDGVGRWEGGRREELEMHLIAAHHKRGSSKCESCQQQVAAGKKM